MQIRMRFRELRSLLS